MPYARAWLATTAAAVAIVTVGGAVPASGAVEVAVSIGDVRVMEPFSGSPDVVAPVPVVLSRPAAGPVTVAWRVRPGTADVSDLVLASGTATVPAGQQSVTLRVPVHGDTAWESVDEWAAIELVSATGAAVDRAEGRVQVRDAVFDGVPAGFVIGDVSVPEPDAGSVRVDVPVTLPAPQRKAATLTWELRSQYTAVVGTDVAAAAGTVTIGKQTVSTTIPITVYGDTTPEPLETVLVKPVSSAGAAIGDPWGQLRVLRDDADSVALPWDPPAAVAAGPGTTFYFESSLGDWVGGGAQVHETLATSGITVSEDNGELRVAVDGDSDTWLRAITSGDRAPIQTGAWTDVHGMQYGMPGIEVSHGAASCSSPDATAAFVVDEVVRGADGSLDRLAMRFEQFCPGSSDPLRGFVRYVRGDPTRPPAPRDPATYPWRPPAGALPATGNWLYVESTPGEWVGQGQTRLLSIDDASAVWWEPTAVQVAFSDAENWRLVAGSPGWTSRWTAGWYPAAYGAVANPVKAPLGLSAAGRGCNAVTGDVVVDTAVHDADGNLTALSLRFSQLCDGQPQPLRGALRWTAAG
jgi:hypothetical protein